jgi:hypothetical protein
METTIDDAPDRAQRAGVPRARDGASAAADPRALARSSRGELDALFARLPVPDVAAADLRGALRGRLLAGPGSDALSPSLRAVAHALLASPLDPWRGKSFGAHSGANRWGVGRGQVSFGRFGLARAAGLDGCGPVLRLAYDVPENVRPLRRIVGELRRLGPGRFLGRMHVVMRRGPRRVLYFTLDA